MIRMEGRFEVRLIDAETLKRAMEYKDFTVRSLAHRAGVSRSTVGHLRSGRPDRRTCQPDTAKAIAKALGYPVELLFRDSVSIVSRESASDAA